MARRSDRWKIRRVRKLHEAIRPELERLEQQVLLTAALDLIGVTAAREQFDVTGRGVAVAVVDTGIARNPRLDGNIGVEVGQDFNGDGTIDTTTTVVGLDGISGGDPRDDQNGHGTHVAGTIGAADDPDNPNPLLRNIGVAPEVRLLAYRVGGLAGSPSVDDFAVLNSLENILQLRQEFNQTGRGTPIVAVNMSLGSGNFLSAAEADLRQSPLYRDAIARLEAAGVTVVSAAGNNYDSFLAQGSASPGVYSTLSVGAVYEENEGQFGSVDGSGNFSGDFTTGPDVNVFYGQRPEPGSSNVIFGPGASILSTYPNPINEGAEFYAELDGTSMASPHVTGVVALVQEAALRFGGRLLDPDVVARIIRSTGDTIVDGDDENSTVPPTGNTYSRVNALNAVREVQRLFEENNGGGGGGGEGVDLNGLLDTADSFPSITGNEFFPTFLPGNLGQDGGFVGLDGAVTDAVNVGGADVDLYRVELTQPGTLFAGTYAYGNSTDVDTYLRLFDENGLELAANDDIELGFNRFSFAFTFVEPGVYYVGVSAFPNVTYDPNSLDNRNEEGAEGDYGVGVFLNAGDPNGTLRGARVLEFQETIREPDFDDPFNVTYESEADLTQSGFLGRDNFIFDEFGNPFGGTVIDATFDDPNPVDDTSDVDMYRVRFEDSGLLTIRAGTDGFSGVDTVLNAWRVNPDGTLGEFLGSNDDEPGGGTFDALLELELDRGTEVLIGVSGFPQSNYDPTTLAGRERVSTRGAYTLLIEYESNDVNGSIPAAQANGALPLPLVDVPGIIGADGLATSRVARDVDFVEVVPDRDGFLQINVDSFSRLEEMRDLFENDVPGGRDAILPVDGVVTLWDAEGNVVATNDDSIGLDPFLSVAVVGGQSYYISVSGFGNSTFNPYVPSSGTIGFLSRDDQAGGEDATGFYLLSAEVVDSAGAIENSDNGIDLDPEPIDLDEPMEGTIGEDDMGESEGEQRTQFLGTNDVDTFRFTAEESGRYTFTAAAFGNFGAFVSIRIFDDQGVPIAQTDDEAVIIAGDTSLTVTLEAGEAVFIGISGLGANSQSYDPDTGATTGGTQFLSSSRSLGDFTLTATATEIFDTTPPTITGLADVAPNPRLGPVSTLDVTFSETIVPGDFTFADLVLTRDGAAVALSDAVTITAVSGSTYRINGLSQFTRRDGRYVLTVRATGINDDAGNAGTGSESSEFVVESGLVEGDYDGDGQTDLATYEYDPARDVGVFRIRPSGGGANRTVEIPQAGANSVPVAGDFDGDGLADAALVDPLARLDGSPTPNASVWIISRSKLEGEANQIIRIPFGAAGVLDRPSPTDFDGDGRTDIATFRADSDVTPGAAQWFILPSGPNPDFDTTQGAFTVVFGASGGVDLPAAFDFDGDGRADIATFRPVSDLVAGAAQWFVLPSGPNGPNYQTTNGAFPVTFGAAGNADQPAVADWDGDGADDLTAFRSISDLVIGRSQWFVLPTEPNAPNYQTNAGGFPVTFGEAGEIAAVGDYNNDDRPDLALFNAETGAWRIRSGTNGSELAAVTFGGTGSRVVPVLAPLFFRLRATDNIAASTVSRGGAALEAAPLGASGFDRQTAGLAALASNSGTTGTSTLAVGPRRAGSRTTDLIDAALDDLGASGGG